MSPPKILLLATLPIGDTLLVEPTVRALRTRYPRATIVALTGSSSAPIWRCMPAIDNVLVLPVGQDWAGPREFLHTLVEIRTGRYDIAIDFTSPALKWVSLIGGIHRRTYMKFDRLWWLIPRRHDRWRATHAVEHYYNCARELDLPAWDSFDHTPRLALPDSEQLAAVNFLRIMRTDQVRMLIGIHPGSAGLSALKRWPTYAFASMADQLCEQTNAEILLLGGPDERDLAYRISADMRHAPMDATGRVPLLASFALIAACDLFIGNDSSLLHAAAALGTPYVGVIGPTSPASFRPIASWSGQGRLVQPDPPCIEPRGFVGSSVIWERPRCRECCAALSVMPPERVVSAALQLLRARVSRPGDLNRDLARAGRIQIDQQHTLPLPKEHVAVGDR